MMTLSLRLRQNKGVREMEEKDTKKGFNYKLYAIIAFVVVAAILAVTTSYAFQQKYIAFDPEKTALNYADTIIQRGDGYNAYAYTISAKSEKYGDFIRIYYMYPLIYPDYEVGMDSKEFKKIQKEKKGYDNEKYQSEATLNDDGTLAGKLADTMYPYYVELIKTYGWDDYDSIYKNYFSRLVQERKAIFGDDFLNDEVMFTAFESNVSTYGNAVTGTEEVIGEDGKTIVQEKSVGLYQEEYGEDYKITSSVVSASPVEDLASYKSSLDPAVLETYGITADDISDAQKVTVQGALEDGTVITSLDVYVVKIGNTWYVDNTTTVTNTFYSTMLSGITAE